MNKDKVYSGCLKKNRYMTLEDVEYYKKKFKKKRKKKLGSYLCPHCNGYHLTSKVKRETKI